MPEIRDWKCGHCGLVIDLPDHDTKYDQFVAALNRIREHRWAHLTETLMRGSDEDLWGLCEDKPAEPFVPSCWADESEDAAQRASGQSAFALNQLANLGRRPAPLADSDDVTPVLEGISELLRDDLPRARQLWYPVNEDGSFNREEDK